MHLFRQFSFILLAMAFVQACKPGQLEPSTENPASTKASVRADSLIKVVIPDFATVISASVTPKEKLDHLTTTYQDGNPGSENGVTVHFLYDANQRIRGYTDLSSPSKGVDNAVIYEYENDKPYRIFNKAINPGQPVFYFMEQWVYGVPNRPNAHLLYRVELDGQARLLSRDSLIYDSANRLIEIKDKNGYHVGQVFDYKGDNLQVVKTKNANGTFSELHTEYHYDDKPNILKGVFLRFGVDYIEHSLSNNNLIGKTFKDNQTTSTPITYSAQYDAQNRLIRRQSTTAGLGLTTEYYVFNN